MSGRHFGTGAPGAPQQYAHFNSNEMIVETRQEASENKAIIDSVKDHTMYSPQKETPGGMRLAARIPLVVYDTWFKDWRARGFKDYSLETYIALKLNSSEWSLLRAMRNVPVFAGQK